MKCRETDLQGLIVVEPRVFGDARGFFLESYNRVRFHEIGIDVDFVQDNHSRSQKGVLRGIHYQGPPSPTAKLVRCSHGAIYDVAVDLRAGSPTFGRWYAEELNDGNAFQLFLPPGFGHGFQALSAFADVEYKTSALYDPSAEGAIRWNDPDLHITWPLDAPILSERDQQAPMLEEYRQRPAFD
jgi:dTDP-4-dehydrorhamnose 3,5-epimerase